MIDWDHLKLALFGAHDVLRSGHVREGGACALGEEPMVEWECQVLKDFCFRVVPRFEAALTDPVGSVLNERSREERPEARETGL